MKKTIILSGVLFFGIIFNCAEAQTTITLQPGPDEGKDAAVSSKDPGNIPGDRESVLSATWTYFDDLMLIRNYLAFDLSSLPENAIITNARLSLFYNPTDPHESWDYHTGENDIIIQRVTSEWDEHNIVWSSQPSITTDNRVKLPPSTSPTQDYLDIDVTNLIVDMTGPTVENHGFMIRMVDELNYYKSVVFASSDHADSSLWPKLVLTYLPDTLISCITFKPNSDKGKDAALWSYDEGINHGDRESLSAYTWTHNNYLSLKRAFVEFDLSVIPENSTIINANLSLFYNPTDPHESFDFHTGENEIYIQRIISPWNEHTIVWDNQPNTTTVNYVTVPPSTSPSQNYLNINVSELVKDMIDSNSESHGFMIRMADEINYYKSVLFASSEHSDAALHPELRVCYILHNSVPEVPQNNFGFKIYPNPAGQIVTIELNRDIKLSLEIINSQGQMVRRISNIQLIETIDISSLVGGTYIVRLVNKDIVAIKKLVVK